MISEHRRTQDVDGSRWAGFGKITTLSVRTGKDHKTCVTMTEFDASLKQQITDFKQDFA
jgi:hypothetical protein